MIDLKTNQNLWTILEIVHKYDKWTSELKLEKLLLNVYT